MQRGRARPSRTKQGGPTCRTSSGCTARTCSISSIDASQISRCAFRQVRIVHLWSRCEQRARLLEAHRERVRQHVERDAAARRPARAAARARRHGASTASSKSAWQAGSSRISSGSTTSTRAGTRAREQRPRARHHAVALVLRVGACARASCGTCSARASSARISGACVETLSVSSRYGLCAGSSASASASASSRSERPSTWRTASATTCGRARAPVDEPRAAPAERLVERLERGGVADAGAARARLEHARRLERRLADRGRRSVGSSRSTSATMRPTTRARLVGHVADARHAPQPVQHEARDRVDHRRVAGDRDHVARGLDRLLLGLASRRSCRTPGSCAGRGARGRARIPCVTGVEPRGQLAIGLPGALDRRLVDARAPRRRARAARARATSSSRT